MFLITYENKRDCLNISSILVVTIYTLQGNKFFKGNLININSKLFEVIFLKLQLLLVKHQNLILFNIINKKVYDTYFFHCWLVMIKL